MHTLQVKSRTAGKAGALRRAGFVPGVVYGPSIDSAPISIARKDLQVLFSEITRSSRIELAIDGEGETRELDVFLKVVEYDPITDEPVHVDFYHADVGHPLKLHVPIRIDGEAVGTKSGGILNVLFNTVRVQGLSKDIPHLITLDVSELELGESIYVRDVDFGDVEPMLPPERTLVTVMAPRGLELPEDEEEEIEGEEIEGEEAEGEEGAPAATAEETAEEE
ncbi:MAG: 50S ribosomal protein L25 [Candidatus Bipolaricaulia bacterium]